MRQQMKDVEQLLRNVDYNNDNSFLEAFYFYNKASSQKRSHFYFIVW